MDLRTLCCSRKVLERHPQANVELNLLRRDLASHVTVGEFVSGYPSKLGNSSYLLGLQVLTTLHLIPIDLTSIVWLLHDPDKDCRDKRCSVN